MEIRVKYPKAQPICQSVGKKLSRVVEAIEYTWVDSLGVKKVVIHAGFLFDGASIPRIFWTMLGLTPHGVMDGPALIHDFLYHYQGRLPRGSYLLLAPNGAWITSARSD